MRTQSRSSRVGISIGALVAIALLSGAGYESHSRTLAMKDFPVPGRLVDIGGGRRLQLDCRGAGAPVVVLEAGLDKYGSLAWTSVHDSIARYTRTCAYSRAGIMWSDPSNRAFDSRTVASDLRSLLVNAGEPAPWVMVGHSIGGPYVTTFANAYPSDVAGMVLVDPSHPEQFAHYNAIAGKSIAPSATPLRIGSVLSWTGAVRALASTASAGPMPADIERAADAFLPLSVSALRDEVEAVPATLRNANVSHDLGDIPLIVLTAAEGAPPEQLAMMGITSDQGRALRRVSAVLHARLAAQSRRGRQVVVSGASHYIHHDRPDVVIAAVREVVDAARSAFGPDTPRAAR